MMCMSLGTMLTLLYQSRLHSSDKIRDICDGVFSSYDLDINDFPDASLPGHLKSGHDAIPRKLYEAARDSNLEETVDAVERYLIKLIHPDKRAALVRAIKRVLKDDPCDNKTPIFITPGYEKGDILRAQAFDLPALLANVLTYSITAVKNEECKAQIKSIPKDFIDDLIKADDPVIFPPRNVEQDTYSPIKRSIKDTRFEKVFTKAIEIDLAGDGCPSCINMYYLVPQNCKFRYAILVPTKALINEIKENMFKALKETLIQTNYRIVTSSGDIVLQQDHHFVFIMTPERLLHMMIERTDIPLDFLFIDEAHKISERGGRSTYYYKVLSQLSQRRIMPTVVFASPNIPNPSIYLNIIPGLQNAHARKLASRYTPVCQFKFFLDFPARTGYYHNPISKKLQQCCSIPEEYTLADMVDLIGHDSQNIIYCNSRKSVLDNAIAYARHIAPKNDETLNSLAAEIKREVHNDCYLADLIVRGIAYHVGYLPNSIRLRIEQSFEHGDIRTIFCTSTLVEGVNLPADNMFITSYKDGLGNMNEVEFRNLVGRIGRIKYNLYGNVFLVRMSEKQKSERYIELLNKDVPEQELSINIKPNKEHIDTLIRDLANGDIEMSGCRKEATDQDYDALRKFGLILTRDLAKGDNTPVLQAVSQHLTAETVEKIRQNFPQERTSDDITLSYDQTVNLQQGISSGTLEYPILTGEEEDFDNIVNFLWKLRDLFKWEIYEKETIGRRGKYQKDSVIRWYATILLQWLRGNGLNAIVYHGIRFKERHPETGVWSGNHLVADRYDPKSKYLKNLVIAESLSTIENVLLFSFSNYFRKFSLEYESFSGGPNPENDWYVFVEYGTMNQHSIFLQKSGFSREATIYIQNPKNYEKYVVEVDGETKIRRSIMECGNTIVENDAKFIQYNLPELFCD